MANGLFGGGTGTSADPYLVEDAQDLNAVRNNLSACYKQVANIDMVSLENWEPIGEMENPFAGGYNGFGYKVRNLKCHHPNTNMVAFFGAFFSPNYSIENLGLEDVSVVGRNNVAGLVGYKNGIVKNCYVTGEVEGEEYVGLLGGNNYNHTTENCYVSGSVVGSNRCGGLYGHIDNLSIKGCFILVDAIYRVEGGTSAQFGDICGSGTVSVNNCYSLDTIEFRQL